MNDKTVVGIFLEGLMWYFFLCCITYDVVVRAYRYLFTGIKRIYTFYYTTQRFTLSVLGSMSYHLIEETRRRCTAIHVHCTFTHGHYFDGHKQTRRHARTRLHWLIYATTARTRTDKPRPFSVARKYSKQNFEFVTQLHTRSASPC